MSRLSQFELDCLSKQASDEMLFEKWKEVKKHQDKLGFGYIPKYKCTFFGLGPEKAYCPVCYIELKIEDVDCIRWIYYCNCGYKYAEQSRTGSFG